MIRFFQNNRKNLAAENKVASYLRYAIGEIALVVVGILIALYINNLNELRKTENRIVEILKEVQNDLGKNILEADKTIEYYKYKKSKIQQILNDELTYDDYKSNPLSSKFFLIGSRHIKLYDNGYRNLMQNVNNIPDEYGIIINPLNELYIYNKYEIDKFDEGASKIINEFVGALAQNSWYYSDATSITISDEMIEFLRSPVYKNFAYRYAGNCWPGLSLALSQFRYDAVDIYMDIAKLIGNEEEVRDYISHNFIKVDSDSLKQYTGTYSLITDDNENRSTLESKLGISLKGDHLVYNSAGDSETGMDIYFRSIDEGYDKNGYDYQFTRNDDNAISGFVRGRYFTLIAGRDTHYEKTE